jgi:hypothetical protein
MHTLQVYIRTRVTMQQCVKLVEAKQFEMWKVWEGNVHNKEQGMVRRVMYF